MRSLILPILFVGACLAALQTLYVQERTDYQNGKAFGAAGPYERIVATATFTQGMTITVDVLKPRDPAKGNGTLVLLIAEGVPVQQFVDGGYTVVQFSQPDTSTVRDTIAFFRYNGSPFLLGDQPRFLKRTIAVVSSDSSEAVEHALATENRDEKNRRLVDGLIVVGPGPGIKAPEDVKVAKVQGGDLGRVLSDLNTAISK